MQLLRAGRRAFTGPAGFLADAAHRAEVVEYLTDLARQCGPADVGELTGHSYGEMAAALVADVVPPDEPVALLVLAFSIHDMWPGRATATYLSHLCPGTPRSFAVCDQGSAAPFTALRLLRAHRPRRALLLAVEQAALPYGSPVAPPAEHRGVALLCADGGGGGSRLVGLHQHADVAPDDVPGLAARLLAGLVGDLPGGRVRVVLAEALAGAWPGHPGRTPGDAGQPTTGVWWELADALAGPEELVVLGDYDRELRYLCMAAVAPPGSPGGSGRTSSRPVTGGW